MKWYQNWIQVFKSGSHKDSAGNSREWSNADLDTIIKNYSTSEQVPVVLGHPKNDEPAYAWVSELKREGDVLFAKLERVDSEFALWVKKGLYRKISIALSEDLHLRHIGFLGAVSPAVKGLSNNFCAAWVGSDYDRDMKILRQDIIPFDKENTMFKKQAVNEFATKIDELKRELEFAKRVNQEKDFDDLLANLQKESKITAEDRDNISDVLKAMYTGNLGQFSEKDKTSANFVAFLNNLPKRCEFSELATNKNAPKGTYSSPQEELGYRIAGSLKG